jgi:ABC-type Zn uptake system ZnuABC Zn-binding protein ZnuA
MMFPDRAICLYTGANGRWAVTMWRPGPWPGPWRTRVDAAVDLARDRRGAVTKHFLESRIRLDLVAGFLGLLLSASASHGQAAGSPPRVRVVVTTTMMGAAVADLAFDWCEPLPLYPAAGCPGQFDLTPRTMAEVEDAALVLVHDYQEPLRVRIAAAGRPWRSVPTTGTQALPGPYLDLCAEVARALAGAFPTHATELQARLDALRRTLPGEAERDRQRAASVMRGRSCLAATFQSDFVAWVGGRAAVTFDRSEEISLRELDRIARQARAAGVTAVVGNEPWGDREARALGTTLNVPWTLLGNYPDLSEPGAWLRLVRANCEKLVELAGDQ